MAAKRKLMNSGKGSKRTPVGGSKMTGAKKKPGIKPKREPMP